MFALPTTDSKALFRTTPPNTTYKWLKESSTFSSIIHSCTFNSCNHTLSQEILASNKPSKRQLHKKTQGSYLEAHSSPKVADGVIRRTTMIVILATRGWLQGATTPCQTMLPKRERTTASGGSWTGMRIVTHWRWLHWGGWGRWRRRWVWSCLDWEGWLYVDSTYPIWVRGAKTLHADISLFSPTRAPGVLNYPIIQATAVGSIPHCKNPVIQVCSTVTCEHTLRTGGKSLRFDRNASVKCTAWNQTVFATAAEQNYTLIPPTLDSKLVTEVKRGVGLTPL